MEITGNTFNEGFNTDLSDFVIKNTQLRYAKNIRIINHEGSTFVISNIKGTEVSFPITSGFVPIAQREHNEVLYLILWNETTKEIEVGSYPSPVYTTGTIDTYRPFNNFNNGAFRTSAFNIPSKPVADIRIQDDYDRSVNVVFTLKGFVPRIVNSKFKVESDGSGNLTLSPITTRPGNANTNSYTTASVEKETRLLLSSNKIMGIDFTAIQSGGKLKPGNYVYVFHYMTEDQNVTNVMGQSSICQVIQGISENGIYAGDETQETDKRVVLSLSNLDTDFKYLKIYCLYSSGQEGLYQQYLEFTKPFTITGETMSFVHTGFEELAEVSQDVVNVDFATIAGADTLTDINGYLFLAGIKEYSYNLTPFRQFAAGIMPSFATKQLSTAGTGGYLNADNVYNSLGYMGGENYAFGVVFVLPGGVLSPVFPIKGRIFTSSMSGGAPIYTPTNQDNGVVTFPSSNHYLPWENNLINAKHLIMMMSDTNLQSAGVSSQVINEVKSTAIGFFFVRAERVPSMLTQGLLVPTVKVPVYEGYVEDHVMGNNEWDAGDQGTSYSKNVAQNNNFNVYKHLICVDNLLEAFVKVSKNNDGNFDGIQAVLTDQNILANGYMPIFLNDLKAMSSSYPEIWYSQSGETYARHWALLSGEALLNESAYISYLNRDGAVIQQLGKINFRVAGSLSNQFQDGAVVTTGLFYGQESFTRYNTAISRNASKIQYVPGENMFGGGDFCTRIMTSIFADFQDGSPEKYRYYRVNQVYNPFFGVVMATGQQLQDSSKGVANPIAGNTRIASLGSEPSSTDNAETYGPRYANFNQLIPAGFLVNVYPASGPISGANCYPTVDNLVYKQVSKRYTWADLTPLAGQVAVFGGDCYVGKIARKLNQSPHRNPQQIISEDSLRSNIDAGQIIQWWQESKYNLALRKPYQFDVSELEKRTFFPYRNQGDFTNYRAYRLPESERTNPGYSETTTVKSFIPAPIDVPSIENEFFSRVYVSDKHIPNAYKNGFRNITSNFRDYTSSLGRIIRLFNHRGNLVVIFEHGIGVTSVEQRVQTGEDAAGSIFVEPKDVLPPNLAFYTQEVGSQQFYSMVQTPQAIYGIDLNRSKIWQIGDNFQVISDNGFSTFMLKNPAFNARSGYDPLNSEVIFTSDNWSLVFREGLERFTSFYSFKPDFYARKGKEMYSFLGSQSHRHNAETFLIYGEAKDAIVEFVINQQLNMTKVLDFIEIISNEIAPSKIEVYTHNQNVEKVETINTVATNQYVAINNENNPFTGKARIPYRDKKFPVQIPLITVYNGGSVSDTWGAKGRMRNKYFIIRLTYQTDKLLQLASVVSNYRFSQQ